MTEKEKRLFLAVKTDDLSMFSELIRENEKRLTIRFGRYPLLSLCYLYNSQKIINEYENNLIKLYDYTLIEEPFEIFTKFKDVAKKSLRLYVLEKNIITPLEMLAILEDSERLKLKYQDGVKTIKITDNISKIYSLNHNQIIKQTEDKIFTKKKNLSSFVRNMLICFVLCSLVFMVIFPFLINQVPKIYGNGSVEHPYQVHTAKQFTQAIKDPLANIIVKKNIKVSNYNGFVDSFSGKIDGGGNSLILEKYKGKTLFGIFAGKITNFNIIIENADYEVLKNHAIISDTNAGEISNINLTINGKISTKSENVEGDILLLSIFAIDNKGVIDNCNITADLKISGSGKDTFFSNFVSKNNKTLSNIKVTENSKIDTDTVDVSSICYTNFANGVIENAVNFAQIKHISSMDKWTPNASGIAFTNNGTIKSSSNFGNITASTTSFEGNAIACGIAVENNKTIENCINESTLSASSPKMDVLIGGISIYNKSNILKSFSKGKIIAKISDSGMANFLLVAGVAVDNSGIIEKSFSSVSFEVSGGKQYVGGISAMVLSDIFLNSIVTKESYKIVPNESYKSIDCYYLTDINIKTTDAYYYYIYNNSKVLTEFSDARGGCKTIETIEELMRIAEGIL